jgi:hypothetical protein
VLPRRPPRRRLGPRPGRPLLNLMMLDRHLLPLMPLMPILPLMLPGRHPRARMVPNQLQRAKARVKDKMTSFEGMGNGEGRRGLRHPRVARVAGVA